MSLDEPGLWKFSLDYMPKKPTAFVNLYNNEWNTNFPEWQDGPGPAACASGPPAGISTRRSPDRSVMGSPPPLLAAVADGPAGKLPKAQAGLSVSRPGVLVTAFGQNPDGAGMLLRLWEQSGTSGVLDGDVAGGV